MATNFKNLHSVMFKAGIETQKELVQKIKEFDSSIPASPVTISHMVNGKLKFVPVDLIYAICKVTDTTPGEWITIDDNPPQFPSPS